MLVLKGVTFITKHTNLPHIVDEANLRTILIKKIKVGNWANILTLVHQILRSIYFDLETQWLMWYIKKSLFNISILFLDFTNHVLIDLFQSNFDRFMHNAISFTMMNYDRSIPVKSTNLSLISEVWIECSWKGNKQCSCKKARNSNFKHFETFQRFLLNHCLTDTLTKCLTIEINNFAL